MAGVCGWGSEWLISVATRGAPGPARPVFPQAAGGGSFAASVPWRVIPPVAGRPLCAVLKLRAGTSPCEWARAGGSARAGSPLPLLGARKPGRALRSHQSKRVPGRRQSAVPWATRGHQHSDPTATPPRPHGAHTRGPPREPACSRPASVQHECAMLARRGGPLPQRPHGGQGAPNTGGHLRRASRSERPATAPPAVPPRTFHSRVRAGCPRRPRPGAFPVRAQRSPGVGRRIRPACLPCPPGQW